MHVVHSIGFRKVLVLGRHTLYCCNSLTPHVLKHLLTGAECVAELILAGSEFHQSGLLSVGAQYRC